MKATLSFIADCAEITLVGLALEGRKSVKIKRYIKCDRACQWIINGRFQ